MSEDNINPLGGGGESVHPESKEAKEAKLEAQHTSDSLQPTTKKGCWQMGCGWWAIIGGAVGLIQALQSPQKMSQPMEVIGTLGELSPADTPWVLDIDVQAERTVTFGAFERHATRPLVWIPQSPIRVELIAGASDGAAIWSKAAGSIGVGGYL